MEFAVILVLKEDFFTLNIIDLFKLNIEVLKVNCQTKAQTRHSQMDTATTVFFFIRDASLKEVRLPTFCGVGLGEKNGMYVYKPTITRTKTSFFRSR